MDAASIKQQGQSFLTSYFDPSSISAPPSSSAHANIKVVQTFAASPSAAVASTSAATLEPALEALAQPPTVADDTSETSSAPVAKAAVAETPSATPIRYRKRKLPQDHMGLTPDEAMQRMREEMLAVPLNPVEDPGQSEEDRTRNLFFQISQQPRMTDGCLVILRLSRESLAPVILRHGQRTTNKFGTFLHSDIIGQPYGLKLHSSMGFIYALRPTPELWTLALPHRTQIVYLPDISFVLAKLDVKLGSVAIEAGTGSGSFSHSLGRAVGRKGKVFSFEFHAERAEKARLEFLEHGMFAPQFTLTHRNVCDDGFSPASSVDAIFLDLPAPWDAIPHLTDIMNEDGARICCFSPCMEQVMRTVSELNKRGWVQIEMFEVHRRTINTTVQRETMTVSQWLARNRKAKQRHRDILNGVLTSSDKAKLDREDAEQADRDEELIILSKPFTEQRGHTAYLTFAWWPGSLGSTVTAENNLQSTEDD